MKSNTFIRYLESVHPLQIVVYHNTQYDFRVYSTSPSLNMKYINTDDPFGDPENKERFYDKCIEYIVNLGLRRIQECLFYCTSYQQGMIMTYRPDTQRKGLWCFSVISILPPRKHLLQPYHSSKKLVFNRLLSISHMPPQALQYVLEVVDIDNKLQRACEHIESKEWDASVFSGNYGLEVTIVRDGVKHINSKLAHRNLKLVEM